MTKFRYRPVGSAPPLVSATGCVDFFAYLLVFLELEQECLVINWNLELTDRLNSRLYALWNRTAGDCLLDSVGSAFF